MNNTALDKKHLELLYSLPDVVWLKLRDSHAFNIIVSRTTTPVSLTLVRNLLTIIATGRNRKWRRKNIDTLVQLLSVDSILRKLPYNVYPYNKLPNTLYWLILLCDVYKSELVKCTPDVVVKVHTKDNSPAYTPYIIGDSIHYDSCLRSGVVNRYKKTGDVLPNQVTEEMYNTVHEIYTPWCHGCNFEYTLKDHRAFHKGQMIYLTVGDLCDVNNTGPEARLRVTVTKLCDSDETIYIMHKLYGNQKYGQALTYKLLEMYPDKVYSFSSVCNYLELSDKSVNIRCVSGYHEDDDTEAYKVLSVKQATNSVDVTRREDYRRIRTTYNNTTVHITVPRIVSERVYPTIELVYDKRTLTDMVYMASPNRPLAYCQSYILSKFNVPHRLIYKYNSWAYLYIPDNTTIKCGSHSITWTFRGYTYAIREYCNCSVLTNGQSEYYNLNTGKWVPSYKVTNYSSYCITRHTMHLIDKFLPRRRNALTLRVVPVVPED